MPAALERCLGSVKSQKIDHGTFEIIVVDNNSARFPADIAERHPDVRFLSEPRPGPGLARNTGAAAARAPRLAFIDADCTAAPGWLQAALDALDQGPAETVVGGDVRIAFLDPQHLSGIEAYEAVFAYRQRMYIEKMGFSGTGNLAMTTETLARVGPFGGIEIAEDKDWGNRATARGYRIRYVERMRIYHPGRTSFAELQRKWQRHIAHDLADLKRDGGSLLRWRLYCLALVASIPVDAVRLLLSPRLDGRSNRLTNRARGIAVLARLRLWRALAGLSAASAPSHDAQDYWTKA